LRRDGETVEAVADKAEVGEEDDAGETDSSEADWQLISSKKGIKRKIITFFIAVSSHNYFLPKLISMSLILLPGLKTSLIQH